MTILNKWNKPAIDLKGKSYEVSGDDFGMMMMFFDGLMSDTDKEVVEMGSEAVKGWCMKMREINFRLKEIHNLAD